MTRTVVGRDALTREIEIQISGDSGVVGPVIGTDVPNLALTGTPIAVPFVVDGGGIAIVANQKIDIPPLGFPWTITGWDLLLDVSGSIVLDIWKDSYTNYPPTVADTITASAKPTVSSATKAQNHAPAGWTTAVAAVDSLRINVDSATTTTRATGVLIGTRA